MVITPTWQAATVGQQANAGHVNQFLGAHNVSFLYQGSVLKSSQSTGSAVFNSTQSAYLAQRILTTPNQTTIGSVSLQLSTVGGSPVTAAIPPITVGIYADVSGLPSGAALASTVLSNEYVYTSPFWVSVPLALSGLTPSTHYQIVTSPVGSASHYYTWQRSNQTAGASTSASGVTWSAQTYGFLYEVFDQTVSGPINLIYEDNGARWTSLTYNSSNQISAVIQYTTAQNNGYLYATNTLTYANGLLTGVT